MALINLKTAHASEQSAVEHGSGRQPNAGAMRMRWARKDKRAHRPTASVAADQATIVRGGADVFHVSDGQAPDDRFDAGKGRQSRRPPAEPIRNMPVIAYVVFTRGKMRDREEYERHREKSRPVNASHPLTPLALYGRHEVLEGPAIEGAVILAFPSIEAAKAYYHSSAYQEVAKHRFLAADYRVFIVEGM
jgi:uncharacterized protein (DUF1330 family)